MEIFQDLRSRGQTIVFVTHDPELAKLGDRIIKMVDGRVVSDVNIEKRSG